MLLQIESFPKEPSCGITQEHYAVADGIATKYHNIQPDSRLDDEIDIAASRGLMKACDYYGATNLTNSLIATCAKNAIISALISKRNSATIPVGQEMLQSLRADAAPDEVIAPDELVDIKMQRELLAKLLDSSLLSQDLKQVITLMMSENEYNQYDIANMLEVQQPAISKRYNKAIAKLRGAVRCKFPLAA